MSDLVERYVHQVGRYLPKKERADIEAELRSLIQDQLDDRFEASPSQAEIATVLTELGDPSQMAASYNRDQYLVGPDLYPYMMMILRHLWVIVPTVVIFLNLFGALASSRQVTLLDLLVETLVALVQTSLIFSAVVILAFGFIQRVITELDEKEKGFDPLTLPEVDDPHSVDRFEATFGIIIAAFMLLVLGYFLQVGGLTLRFNQSNPDDVIPVPMSWLIAFMGAILAMLIMQVWVLRRNRWNATLWQIETILELFGMVCLYFVIYEPLLARILIAVPSLANVSFINSVPEIIVIVGALITLIGRGSRLVALRNYHSTSSPAGAIKSGR